MEGALRELLTSPVGYRSRVGSDAYDAPSYGAPLVFAGRVVEERRELRLPDSRIVATHGYVILDADAWGVQERDELTIDGHAVEVLAVSRPRDVDGTIHHVRAVY